MAKFFGFIIKWSIIAAVWLGILLGMVLFYYYHDLPKLEDLELEKSGLIVQVNYSNGSKINTFGDLYDSQITYTQLPAFLVDAVVATEDRKFFSHSGIDIFGILRASIVNYRAGRVVQGGSTITQQLAKLIFLKPERTFKRKIQEVLLAIQLENTFSKEQIITLYLNHAYFGAGNYGVASASKYYFHKPISKINLNEAAMLAGLLKAPSKLAPTKHQNLAENRANQVLNNMIDAGYLNEDNLDNLSQKVNYQTDRLQRLYFADFVNDQYPEYLSKESKINNNRFIISTTLDEGIQNIIEDAVNDFVSQNEKKLGKSQVAVVVMSKEGAVLGMIGGRDYQKSPFNRAAYSKRQAGSAFKTFIYLTAFQNGFKPDDVIEDKKVNIGSWEPENYEKKYYGEVTLKKAFAMSLNSVAISLSQNVDKNEIIGNARKLGIISPLDKNDPTIALGTAQVNLLELVSSYATIANDGIATIPYSIKKINGNEGVLLYERESSGIGNVIDEESLLKLKEILREVVVSGTGKNANVSSDIFGKTGTSQNYRDAWFVGFNDSYVIGVWIGNDDNSPTNQITGGSLPAELFARIIRKI